MHNAMILQLMHFTAGTAPKIIGASVHVSIPRKCGIMPPPPPHVLPSLKDISQFNKIFHHFMNNIFFFKKTRNSVNSYDIVLLAPSALSMIFVTGLDLKTLNFGWTKSSDFRADLG